MKFKKICNLLLTASLVYCLSVWLFLGLSLALKMDVREWILEAIVISFAIALGIALLVGYFMKRTSLIMSFSEKKAFLEKINTELNGLGFQNSKTNRDKYTYKGFLWFSLKDPNIKVHLKDENTAVIKGRDRDVSELVKKLNGI
jgi:hypothetical protein